jgi:hypothetical protein
VDGAREPDDYRTRLHTHLYAKANHDDEMALLGALALAATPKYHGDNVIPLHG